MSRTYRKVHHWVEESLYWDWVQVPFDGKLVYTEVRKTPTKREIALTYRDKPLMGRGRWKRHSFKQVHVIRRMDVRNELSKVYRLEDWEDCNFDDSHSYAYYKRVLWFIY